jgi:hypothetical protein
MGQNPLNNRNDVANRKHLASCVKLLTMYFEKWKLVFPTHEVSKAQLAVYLEALKSLSTSELEDGCREVIKTALTFPKPAEIIAAAKVVGDDQGEYLGPKMLEYPEVPEEERKSADDITAEFKKRMGWDKPNVSAPTEKRIKVVPPTRSLEEQKAELVRRGFLTAKPHDPKCLCPDCQKRREKL